MDLVGRRGLTPENSAVIVPFLTSAHSGEVALKNDRHVSSSLNKIWSPLDKDPDAIPFFTRKQSTFILIGKHIGNPAKEDRERLPLWVFTHIEVLGVNLLRSSTKQITNLSTSAQ
jgi:hypothetical protein